MSYKALYRKYRPQNFSQVVGQASITKTLQNAIISGKISHAYLFCGPRGTGKTTVARIFAKALNCQNIDNGEPCLNCINCKEISESMSPDVVEIDAASNNGVDEIRDIREKVKFLPSGAKYKIYIIDEVHMLSTGAFNALLKTLEEPPKHVVFILATTEPQKLPATIISRCQRFDFKPLGTYEISMQLKSICEKEEATITEDAINAISEAAEGGMRDALSILDQVISYGNKDINIEDVNTITGTISFDKMNLLMNYIESKNINYALETINDFIYTGKEASKIITAMLVYCRDILLYISVGSKNTSKYIFEKAKFQELALKIPTNKILFYIDVLSDVQNKIKNSTTPNVYLEIAIIKMCNVTDSQIDILKRMNDLETKLESGEYSVAVEGAPSSQDNEKLSMLDTKINQVVNEFNKLELHKLGQKLDDLGQIVANRLNEDNASGLSEEFLREFEDIKISVSRLKNDALVENNYNEKINELENEITELKNNSNSDDTRVVFNEVVSLKQEVNILKNNASSNVNSVDTTDIQNQINVLQSELDNIKNRPETKEVVYTTSSNNTENDAAISQLKADINELKDYITSPAQDNKEYTKVNNYDEKIAKIDQEISDLKNSNNIDYQEEIDSLTRKINSIYERINQTKAGDASNDNYDLTEIKEKLQTLENRMYKFISSALSNTSKEKTKPASKKPSGQIMLFGDEILSVNDIEKSSKENTDFDELTLTEEEKAKQDEEKEALEVIESAENVEDKNEEVLEESKEENALEEQVQETNQDETKESNEGLFESNIVIEKEDKEETVESDSNNLFSMDSSSDATLNEEKPEETVEEIKEEKQEDLFSFISSDRKEKDDEPSYDDYSTLVEEKTEEVKEVEAKPEVVEEPQKPKVPDVILNQYYDSANKEQVVNKVNSSLVVRETKKEEALDTQTIESVLRHEREVPKAEEKIEEKSEIIVGKQEDKGDKFALYDVKDVEQILHDSRSPEARNDKVRVTELWKNLSRGIQPDLIPLAEMLQQATICAVGNKELIITYPNVSLCNQVMRSRFKREALRILYSKLGDAYNYIALPFDTWNEKKTEYVQQYQIGIKKPKLTKLNIPGLNVIDDTQEYVGRDEKVISKAREFFGDDIVEVK